MKLNTPSDRFFLFTAVTIMFAYAYQHYHIYQNDKNINEAIEQHNKTIKRYVFLFNGSKKENRGLKHHLDQLKSENQSLVEQIDHVANYYQREVIKLKDEIMDLKYGDKNERNN